MEAWICTMNKEKKSAETNNSSDESIFTEGVSWFPNKVSIGTKCRMVWLCDSSINEDL